jgi:hypothetical protein
MREEESKSAVSFAESLEVIGRKAAVEAICFDSKLRPATAGGVPSPFTECSDFGLLAEDKKIRTGAFLWWPFYARAHVGTVRLYSDFTRKEASKRWVLVVYGRENVERMTKLADHLAQKFGVEVHVRLEKEDNMVEQRD